MRMALLSFLLILLVAASAGAGVRPEEILDDPALEARARALGQQLRCLVCQNQSIDDSDAPLAADLRRIVREQLVAGKSEEEIKAYLVARYGDFILLKPPVKPATWGLWIGPFLLLGLGGVLAFVYLRRSRRGATTEDSELSEEERSRLAALLGEDAEGARMPTSSSSP